MRHFGYRQRSNLSLLRTAQFISLLLFVSAGLSVPLVAATFTVNSTGDSHATNLATGQDAGGFISLRSALETATATAGSHVINFSLTGTINLSLGQITAGNAGLGSNISITGPGAGLLTINQTTVNRVFSTGTGAVTFTLQDVTLHYAGPAGVITGGGGAIIAGGAGASTSLINCVISGFNIQQGNGGAISASTSLANHNLTVTNCTFTDNTCGGAGGAVSYNGLGVATITKSLFSNNRTGAVGISLGGDGGALSTTGGGSGGSYSITQCTFIDNHSASHGGVLSNTNGQLTIQYSRLFNNNAATPADGNVMWQSGGSVSNTITARDNWWGQNTGPAPNDLAVGPAPVAQPSVATWLQLRNISSPNPILAGNATSFSADILGRNSGGPIAASNIAGLANFAGRFDNAVLGTLPTPTVNVIFVNGQAGAVTFTSGAAGGIGSTDVHADNQLLKGQVTINQPPSVTLQPRDTTVCAGSQASFRSAAVGFPVPAVQWQVSTDGGTTWNDIPGANASPYTFPTVAGDSGHRYRAIWGNGIVPAATSNPATLVVNSAPVITTQPLSASAPANSNVTFIAAASGSPSPTVQWQVSTDNGATFVDVPGATSPTLNISAISVSQNGYQYHSVFTNSCGVATSAVATLTVTGAAPSITLQPTDTTVCAGSPASFSSAASGTPTPSLQWQVTTDAGTTWANIPPPGGTANPLTFAASSSDNRRMYRAVFTNVIASVNSSAATLKVNTAPDVTTPPADEIVSNGSPASFTAAASGTPPPSVQWQVSTDGGSIWSIIPGATDTTLNLPPVSLSQNGYEYRALFNNACGADTSDVAFLTVKIQANDLGPVTVFLSRLGGFFDREHRVTLMAELYKNGTVIGRDSLVNQRVEGFIFPSSKRYVIPVRASNVPFLSTDLFKVKISVRGTGGHNNSAVLMWYNDDSVKNSSRGWSRVYKSTIGGTQGNYYYLRVNNKLSVTPGTFGIPSLVVVKPGYQSFGTWSIQGSLLTITSGTEQVETDVPPTAYSLSQNFPNPFNPSTAIQFDIPSEGNATLKVYDIIGQEVAVLVNDNLSAGRYRTTWDASQVASGVYFYRLQARDFVQTRKLLLLR